MNNDWAEQNLATIRSLMENAALYRRALAPLMTTAGGLGIAASVVSCFWEQTDGRTFAFYWLSVALLGLICCLFLVRRQAFKSQEMVWSPPAKKVVQAMLPGFASGAFFGLAYGLVDPGEGAVFMVAIWMVFYGCAVHAAGFFMPRGMKLFGWISLISGLVLILAGGGMLERFDMGEIELGHYLMGGFFGLLHLVYGIYLFMTEKKETSRKG